MKNLAVILAAGSGKRFGDHLPKQFQKIAGRTLIEICLERFQTHPGIDAIVLVCPAPHLAMAEEIVSTGHFNKVVKVIAGGKTRQESSFIGVSAAPAGVENILIHDAARALVAPAVVSRVLEALAADMAVMATLPAGDTIIRIDDAAMVMAVLDRAKLGLAQTPQGFKLAIIRRAHELARADGFSNANDDCSLVLRYKLAPVVTVLGDPINIKITYPQDLIIAKALVDVF
jgi:2-C-methyl-D-erythritol 4-phosphate cytidylyltransferase